MLQQLIDFSVKHWLLVSAFILAFMSLIMEEARSKGLGGKSRLSTQETVRMMNQEQAQVIDIRELAAYQVGHIVGSINIPLNDLKNDSARLASFKERNLIIVCENGQKSPTVISKLRKAGYTDVYLLLGGLSAWKTAGLPLAK